VHHIISRLVKRNKNFKLDTNENKDKIFVTLTNFVTLVKKLEDVSFLEQNSRHQTKNKKQKTKNKKQKTNHQRQLLVSSLEFPQSKDFAQDSSSQSTNRWTLYSLYFHGRKWKMLDEMLIIKKESRGVNSYSGSWAVN